MRVVCVCVRSEETVDDGCTCVEPLTVATTIPRNQKNRYEQLLSDATKRGTPVPGLVSAAMAPYTQSMTRECLSPACTERCGLRGVGNLTVAEELEGLTGFYVGISGWDYGCVVEGDVDCGKIVSVGCLGSLTILSMLPPHSTPPCDDACESQDLELLKANIAEHGPASICVNAATWNDYVEVRVRLS